MDGTLPRLARAIPAGGVLAMSLRRECVRRLTGAGADRLASSIVAIAAMTGVTIAGTTGAMIDGTTGEMIAATTGADVTSSVL